MSSDAEESPSQEVAEESIEVSTAAAQELAAIVDRQARGIFPEVAPPVVEDGQADMAQELIRWWQKVEYSRTASYIAEQYAKFICDSPPSDKPASIQRAQWAREFYYVHLKAFRDETEISNQSVLDAAGAVLHFDKLSEEKRLVLERMLQCLKSAEVENLVCYIQQSWAKFWESLPEFARISEGEMQASWLIEKGEDILTGFLEVRRSNEFVFVPELPVANIVSASDREEAALLVAKVRLSDVCKVEEAVSAAYEEAMCGIPAWMRTSHETDMRRQFLEGHYFSIIRGVVGAPILDEFCFKPLVSVEALLTEELREEARVILRTVKEQHVPLIDTALSDAFEAITQSVSFELSPALKESMWDSFIKSEYYRIVKEITSSSGDSCSLVTRAVSRPLAVVGAGVGSSGGGDGPAAFRGTSLAESSMLVSPKRRRVVRAPSDSVVSDITPQYVTLGEVHSLAPQVYESHIFEAYLLYWPDATKFVEVKDRRTQEVVSTPVMNCLLADGDGAVVLDLWRTLATESLANFEAWSTDTQQPILVEVKSFVVKLYPQRALCPLRKISATERSQIRRLETGSRSSVRDLRGAAPSPSLFIKDMSLLQESGPYVVNVCGVVHSILEERVSQNGNSMRSFQLSDSSGKTIMCTALGRHVDNTNIRQASEIVVFFAAALKPTSGNGAVQLWLYDESHLVLLRKDCAVPRSCRLVICD